MDWRALLALLWMAAFAGVLMLARFGLTEEGLYERLRPIPLFTALYRGLALAMEAGWSLHYALGQGSLWGEEGGMGLAGLSTLKAVGRFALRGDRPPEATTGDGLLYFLGRSTLRRLCRENHVSGDCSERMHLMGLMPWGYVVGVLSTPLAERTEVSVAVGHFGPEIGLLTETAPVVLTASEDLSAQALMYAAADETLVGEDVFAAPAYARAGASHLASLLAQDVFRWILVLALLLGGPLYLIFGGGG